MADSERSLVPFWQKLPSAGEVVEDSLEQKIDSLYEKAIAVLRNWIFQSARKEGERRYDGIIGPDVTAEIGVIYAGGMDYDPSRIGYDDNDIPGLWVGDLTKSRQVCFRPLLPINHLFIAYHKPRAARGLIFRVPDLKVLINESGLEEEDVLAIIGAASSAAATAVEESVQWGNITNKDAAVLLGCGCLALGPVLVLEKIRQLGRRVLPR